MAAAVSGMTDHMAPGGARVVVDQTAALARRALVGTLRQPSVWFPGFFFPLMIAAVNSAALGDTTRLPGFPDVDSFLQFLLPATLIQGVLFGGIVAGSDMALDVQDGFFERLVASPVRRTSILLGRMAGAAVLGGIQALVFIGVFMLFGAHVDGGIPAILTLVLLGIVLAVAVGSWAAGIGLRTGSAEAVQNSFPLVFILLFISSAFFPTDLMTGVYQAIAELNPLSWMINAARDLVIDEFTWRAALQALGIASALLVLSSTVAVRQLQRRLEVAS
jgi:ABC-2 type transport system permease protein